MTDTEVKRYSITPDDLAKSVKEAWENREATIPTWIALQIAEAYLNHPAHAGESSTATVAAAGAETDPLSSRAPAAGDAGGVVDGLVAKLESLRISPTGYTSDNGWRITQNSTITNCINAARDYFAALPALSRQWQTDVSWKLSRAAEDVFMERKRQVMVEGWTPEHDDEHDGGEMGQAAACYASRKPIYVFRDEYEDGVTGQMQFDGAWPWDAGWWKPKTRRSNLVRAGALILAEIERLDRIALPAAPKREW